ncbi:hypothetical protein LNKW23_19280 [Paralimibaculum aggregatum]|uniref:LysM domain-containing protein n=1 Tax=Paralimibaculum aggregatum TaxID=3036245 RepID=A0ABQ6LKF1_9RHOB|nr:LysM domain-containing protein [Limibaculum sp. NKW23]GMG82715.1 hypothetical protein LNKW23_19280 [Limibaculum sp. NKW23]
MAQRWMIVAAALLLGACAGDRGDRPAPQPIASTGDGIVQYDGYTAALARDGETVAQLAGRIGVSASALAAYNGLTPGHSLRDGDELVIPPAG